MPTARYALSAAARGLKAFLNLEAGVVRVGAAPLPEGRQAEPEKRGEVERLRGLLAARDRQLASLRAGGDGGVRPENLVWIFGTGRSGNTWLSSMMGDIRGHATWGEPRVGMLFGEFYFVNSFEGQRKSNNFILGEKQKATWLGSIRSFVLDGARSRFPDLNEDGYLTIKEQVGSVGAPLMMEALPESRMVLLVRDPRDVVASVLDASREGAWHHERRKGDPGRTSSEDPNVLAEERAERYLKQVGAAKKAYDDHGGPKALVRYEELRADALGTMGRMYSVLGVPVGEEELSRVVEKHSWENIPPEKRGEGKFYRKARPGGWREDLTAEQAEAVERVTAPLLEEFYPSKA
ncbi:MAG: sulfotransferase domain-containing protein [Rubrobacter sp.]